MIADRSLCFQAFIRLRALPSAVRGPVECFQGPTQLQEERPAEESRPVGRLPPSLRAASDPKVHEVVDVGSGDLPVGDAEVRVADDRRCASRPLGKLVYARGWSCVPARGHPRATPHEQATESGVICFCPAVLWASYMECGSTTTPPAPPSRPCAGLLGGAL